MSRRASTLAWVTAFALVIGACAGDAGTTTTAGDGATTTAAPGTTASPDTTAAPSTTAEGSDEPIVVGGTLALTGAFAATGAIHRIAGEMFVERLNEAGGLLGREVQWNLLDDESDTANIAPLYEQLISQDQVDLIMGPYATPNILAAMPVAERYGYTLPQHTAVLAPLMSYACQFPGWSIGPEPNSFIPNQIADQAITGAFEPRRAVRRDSRLPRVRRDAKRAGIEARQRRGDCSGDERDPGAPRPLPGIGGAPGIAAKHTTGIAGCFRRRLEHDARLPFHREALRRPRHPFVADLGVRSAGALIEHDRSFRPCCLGRSFRPCCLGTIDQRDGLRRGVRVEPRDQVDIVLAV